MIVVKLKSTYWVASIRSAEMGVNRTSPDQYQLRFPVGMRERLKATADQNGRSMNAEIIARLEDSLGMSNPELNIDKAHLRLKRAINELRDAYAELELVEMVR